MQCCAVYHNQVLTRLQWPSSQKCQSQLQSLQTIVMNIIWCEEVLPSARQCLPWHHGIVGCAPLILDLVKVRVADTTVSDLEAHIIIF